jgi:putative DNA primase/helicase
MENNIKQTAQAALKSIESVLNQWCPGGKRQGNEYVVLNPTRHDHQAGSFSINLNTGAWADFATDDKGGDLVALVAYINGVNMGEAANQLVTFLGLAGTQVKQDNASASVNPNQIASGEEKAMDNGDGFECMLPIPMNAPPPIKSHRRHGKPTKRYTYLNLNDDVNFYHDRFEPKKDGERKQFAPLTLWRNQAGEFEWRYKALPNNRPLYNLPSLLTLPNATVWIVEGEKAADALIELMPDKPIVTWQGGSQAVFKADFTPLSGRNCVLWPDNDQAGIKAKDLLIQMLQAVGVKSIKQVDLGTLAREVKTYGYELKAGDDAFDLQSAGFTSERLASLMFKEGLIINPLDHQGSQKAVETKEAVHEFKRHFQLLDDGVYMVDVTSDKNAYKAPKWICANLEVLALSRSSANGEWGMLVVFQDRDYIQHRFIISAKSFNGDGLDATAILYDNGLSIAPKSRQYVLEYLQQQAPEKRVRITNRIGWHGEDDNAVYVMPDGAIGGSVEEWILDGLDPNANTFKQKGTIESWRNNAAKLCIGNSRLVFAASISFAAPLRYLIEIKDLGGFHYRGSSSDGKSTALRLAGSVCGGDNYMQRWRATDNGLEGLAMQHCDAPLLLDELKQIDPKVAGDAAYMLANGAGKARSNERGAVRKTAEWRLIFLSAGEIGLSQHMQEANKRIHAGQEIRMADIPVDAGAGFGCFENLHGCVNGSAFAQSIAEAISKDYGVAFPAFIEWVQSDREEIKRRLLNAQKSFEDKLLSETASGQARRVASIFALVGAAGELATEAGLTGWPTGEAFKAAETCYKAWLDGFGGEGNQEERAMLSHVRLFLEQHGEGRFADLGRNAVDDDHAARVLNRAGYRKHHEDLATLEKTTEWLILPETFRTEVCKGFDYKAVAKLLVDKGYMHKGDGRNLGTPKRETPDGRKRVYVVYSKIFDDEH